MLPSIDIIRSDVNRALQEDLGAGDITSSIIDSTIQAQAKIISREPMVVCGIPWVEEAFKACDNTIHIDWHVSDGDILQNPTTLCDVSGPIKHILSAERTALNFLQTLSGTATMTKTYVDALAGTSTKLLDTRKTIPGLRAAQKYAALCGGAQNHRFGLYDAVLIKENHIAICGSIAKAVDLLRADNKDIWIEIEVENMAEYRETMLLRPNRILLDNFTHTMLKEVLDMHDASICSLEVSGNISIENIRSYALPGIDYISVGSITKSVRAVDLSLLIESYDEKK
jgi:nicotinate-nucleotide pyrophosphorylase (carboxylating)